MSEECRVEECAEFDLAFHDLRPVAGQFDLGDRDPRLGVRRPGRRLEFRHRVGAAPYRPRRSRRPRASDKTRCLAFSGKRARLRLRRHVDDVAVGVELPAVIEAAQSAFLVAAEGERGLAVRTGFAEQPGLAVGVAERDQLFAEQLHPHRRAVRLCDLFGQQRRHPVAAHQPSHRRIALDPAQQFVLGLCQHGKCSALPKFLVS